MAAPKRTHITDFIKDLSCVLPALIDLKINKLAVAKCKDLNSVPTDCGCYWIETTMPLQKLTSTKKWKKDSPRRVRMHSPPGTEFITQVGESYYVIYNGTEDNLQKRLMQHLFNAGNRGTGKLGLNIGTLPFSRYKWRISWIQIPDKVTRYALELWWRHHIGWPICCIK